MDAKQKTMVNAILLDTSEMLTGKDEEFARDLRRYYWRLPLSPKQAQRLERLNDVIGND